MTATKRKPKPITANPLFPFVTALWLATFFGLGSFAVAPALLEGPVVALGIPALVPSAAPPLGFTARVMFALAMLGVGAVAGYVIGRLLGREKREAPVRMRSVGKSASDAVTVEVYRPINAAEDLGEPLDAPVFDEAPSRRRTFALTDESPFAVPAQTAELSAGMPWERAPVPESEPLFPESLPAETLPVDAMLPQSMAVVDPLALDLLFEEATAAGHAPFTSAPHDFSEDQPDARLEFVADLDERDPAETGAASIATSGSADEPLFAPNAEPSYLLQAHAVAATPIDRAPLDTLGLVQLVERLALAISRRTTVAEPVERAAPAEFMVVAPPPPPAIARFESSSVAASGAVADFAQPEAGPEAGAEVDIAAPWEPVELDQNEQEWDEPQRAETHRAERVVQLRPAMLQPPRPIDLPAPDIDDEEEHEDLGLDRFLRMSPLVTRNRAPTVEAADDDVAAGEVGPEAEVVEDRYPSLLDMGPVVARREPLRIDDSMNDALDDATGIEPVVVFPGQESSLEAGPAPSGQARPFERPSIIPLPGSPLASPGRAAPSSPLPSVDDVDMAAAPASLPDAEEADRALRAALATLQRMTAQG